MKITKVILTALFFGLVLVGCKKDEVLLPETNEPEVIEPETPEFGFAEDTAEGQLIIEAADSIVVNLPEEYQTVKVVLEPLHPLYSHTPETKVSAALVEGEWAYEIKCDEDNNQAIIAIKAEIPTFTEALLTVTIIDTQGLKQEISKVLKRDVSEDYRFDKETKTYTVKSLNGMRMVNKLLYAFLNDDSYDNDDMNVTLETDISLPLIDDIDGNYEQNWISIADRENPQTMAHRYQGVFDGAGYTIKDVITSSDNDYVGLFGVLGEKAVIKNLTVDCREMIGQSYVGVIAGANYGTIMNCHISGRYYTIIKGNDNLGGIAGINGGYIILSTMNKSGSSVTIKGGSKLGGIAGRNCGYIDQCQVFGFLMISGSGDRAGGIAGVSEDFITNCTVIGDIHIFCEELAGGIVGEIFAARDGLVLGCSVTKAHLVCRDDEGEYCGAIAGLSGLGTIVACYAKESSVESAGKRGGIAGDAIASHIIACVSYLCEGKHPSDEEYTKLTGMSGILGDEEEGLFQCYYKSSKESPLTGVDTQNGELADNWEDAIIKMNEAIDDYNAQMESIGREEKKCGSYWSGEISNPVFVTASNN